MPLKISLKIPATAFLAFLVFTPAAHSTTWVRDESVVEKMRDQSRSLEAQTGLLEQISATGFETRASIGDPAEVSVFTRSAAERLDVLPLGGGYSRLSARPPLHDRMKAPASPSATGLYAPDPITAEEEDLETYESSRTWILNEFFRYRDGGDIAQNVESSRNIAAARSAFFRNAGVEAWAVAVQGQQAVTDAGVVAAEYQELLQDSENLRSDIQILAQIGLEQARSQAATNHILAAALELEALAVLADAPPLVRDRLLNTLREFGGSAPSGDEGTP